MHDPLTTAACYARTVQSNEDQIAGQVRTCRAAAEAVGLVIPGELVFVDDGFSGLNFERPAWRRMYELALGGNPPFRTLVLAEVSRISRAIDPCPNARVVGALADAGVRVLFGDGSFSQIPDAETANVTATVMAAARTAEAPQSG